MNSNVYFAQQRDNNKLASLSGVESLSSFAALRHLAQSFCDYFYEFFVIFLFISQNIEYFKLLLS